MPPKAKNGCVSKGDLQGDVRPDHDASSALYWRSQRDIFVDVCIAGHPAGARVLTRCSGAQEAFGTPGRVAGIETLPLRRSALSTYRKRAAAADHAGSDRTILASEVCACSARFLGLRPTAAVRIQWVPYSWQRRGIDLAPLPWAAALARFG